MKKSTQIQIGLLVLIAGLLAVNLVGGFDGLFGGSDSSASDLARQSLTENTAVTGQAQPGVQQSQTFPINANGQQQTQTVEPAKPTGPTTAISWSEKEFDFGTIEEGEKVSHTFTFKNSGNEQLIITNAKASCGCTVPKWPKEPIAPGDSGEILVEYNSKGKKGGQDKTVTIEANVPGGKDYLKIKANVLGGDNTTTTTPPVQ